MKSSASLTGERELHIVIKKRKHDAWTPPELLDPDYFYEVTYQDTAGDDVPISSWGRVKVYLALHRELFSYCSMLIDEEILSIPVGSWFDVFLRNAIDAEPTNEATRKEYVEKLKAM